MPGVQFLNPAAGVAAAAVAVPLLVLLYFLKLRRSPAEVSSTLLWHTSVHDLQVNAPFQRIRRNLLLLLQLLVVAALALALARPVAAGQERAGERSILLIDRSASMNATDVSGGGTRLDAAKAAARGVINTMRPGDEAMVIAFSDAGGTAAVQPFTTDARLLRQSIDAVTPGDRPTLPASAYELANASSSFMDERLREDALRLARVFLFSDGRVSDAAAAELSLRGEMRYQPVGTSDARNLAVVALGVRRNFENPTEAQAFARAANYGPAPERAQLVVSVAQLDSAGRMGPFQTVPTGPVEVVLPPARWDDPAWRESAGTGALREADAWREANVPRDAADVRLDLPGAGVVRVEVHQQGRPVADALAADDAAHVTVPPPEPLRVLLATSGSYWLRLLLETQRLDNPVVVTPEDYAVLTPEEAAGFDVTIFDGWRPDAVPEAGTFVFSGVLPPDDATGVSAVTDGAGVPLFYEASGVLDWDRTHPTLRGLNLNRLFAADGRLVTLPTGAELLIEGVGGPMAVLEQRGRRRNLIFTFDLARSTWPRQQTFPIFFYNLFEYFATTGDVRARESLRPGETVAVQASALRRVGTSSVALIAPDGGRTTHAADGEAGAVLGPFEAVGLYRTDPPVPGFEVLAVSLLDPVESNLLPAATDPGDLSGTGASQSAPAAPVTSASRDIAGAVGVIEWWWYLVAAGVGLLLVEWLVYVRRVAA